MLRQQYFGLFVPVALALTFLLGLAGPSAAVEGAKPAPETNWRPKDGTYADLASDFTTRCGENGDLIVALSEKSIGGNGLGCKINKLTDTAPNAIRLDITCNDYNLAQEINDPNPYERKFKEIMLLKRIDDKTVFVRKTLNKKFSAPGWQASFCPDAAQRMYQEAKRRNREEARKSLTTEKTVGRNEPWHPKDGVYANSGTNFDDRCTKDDIVLGLTEGFAIHGEDKCNVFTRTDSPPDEISVAMICGGRPVAETMRLKKVDDSTIILRRTRNGQSYCAEEIQRKHKAALGSGGTEIK